MINDEKIKGMILIPLARLKQFTKRHTDTISWIENWKADVEGFLWQTPDDIKKKYPSVSFLKENIVIFNVKGNRYRLETKINYKRSIVWVAWIRTHKEYDKRNKKR